MLPRGLFHTEESFYILFVDLGDEREVSQIAFLLFGLFGENVALESVFSLDLS